MAKKERLTITKEEHYALNMIEGLEPSAFDIMIGAKRTKNGRYVLEGSPEAFDALTGDLSDEIHYGLSPKSRIKHLEKLYDRLSPIDSGF